jgi:hypothetical protein
MVAGSETMRAASARASANIEGVSAIIEENASAAAEVGSTTVHERDSLTAVTVQSQSQSAASNDVSSSVLSLAGAADGRNGTKRFKPSRAA